MTHDAAASALTGDLVIAPAPRRRREWRRAWRAVQALMDDPERTEKAFEVIAALSGPAGERSFRRFVRDPTGRALLAERPVLLARLADSRALAAMPEGSLGRAYLAFMRAQGLDPGGLVTASETSEAMDEDLDPERRWFFDRMRDMHDVQHVLAGYGSDEGGEAANLAFTYAQERHLGMLLIVLAILTRGLGDSRLALARSLLRGWRRGRRAAWLVAVPIERLLPRPLAEVRLLLRIAP